VPAQSHIASQNILKPYDRIIKCNNKTIKNVKHLEEIIYKQVKQYNDDPSKTKNGFIVLQTPTDKIYFNMHHLLMREIQDSISETYPKKKCQLLHMESKQKRKRRRKTY
tara:strand:+ start:91 stop:417 length:327 start_codon:yes stop_codon:yes gene_type:complete